MSWVQMGRTRKGAWRGGGGGRYQRPQRYRTAGAGPGVGSRRGANLREILSRVTHKSPSAEPSPKTRRGAGEEEHTGTRPCPAEAWEPRAWPPPDLPVPAAAPGALRRPVIREAHTHPAPLGKPIASSAAAGPHATAAARTAASGS